MRYISTGVEFIPKHSKYGPRMAEGILLSDVEWWSITDHLVKDQREKEFMAVQRRKEEAKKEVSYEMTRTWKNTLASIKTLGNQRRLERLEHEKREKINKYNEIMKNRIAEKQQLLEDVKKILYEDRDAIKMINSAVLLSTVIEERKKQVQFNKYKEEAILREDKEMSEKYKKDAEDFAREKIEEKIKERAKIREQKIFLDKQMEEVKRKKQLEAEEKEVEKQDMINMRLEFEKIRNCEMKERQQQKEFSAKYIQKTPNQLKVERLLVLEQDEEDAINKLYQDYDRRFRKERKEREEKMKNEVIIQRNKVAEQLGEKIQKAAKKELNFLEASLEDKEEEERREEQRKEKLRKEAVADLLESKRKAMEERALQELYLKEQKKWEMLQQYRAAEINEEWRQRQKIKKKEMQRQLKADYDRQCKEMKEQQEKDLKEWLAPLVSEEKEKDDIRTYCNSTLEYVRKHNLPEYPVLVAIKKVKKEYDVTDEKKETDKDEENDEKKLKTKPITGFCYCFKD